MQYMTADVLNSFSLVCFQVMKPFLSPLKYSLEYAVISKDITAVWINVFFLGPRRCNCGWYLKSWRYFSTAVIAAGQPLSVHLSFRMKIRWVSANVSGRLKDTSQLKGGNQRDGMLPPFVLLTFRKCVTIVIGKKGFLAILLVSEEKRQYIFWPVIPQHLNKIVLLPFLG